jgi:YesN/AraC family two-component response regulator
MAKILIVEDEEMIRRLLAVMLSQIAPEAEVVQAENGQIAWNLVQEGGFDLLITDVTMPGEMSGLDLTMAIRQQEVPIRVLIMSGATGETEAFEAGCDAFFAKPFNSAQFLEAVNTLLFNP